MIGDLDRKVTFSRPLGKTLADAVNLEINLRFLPLKTGQNLIDLDEDFINDLSSYQKYIRNDKVPTDLTNMEIGPVCHSFWLTIADRFTRIYISKHGITEKIYPI